MSRRVLLSLLLLALPALCAAEDKKPKRAYVGVMIAAGEEKGTFQVRAVFPDSPADKAGLRDGDVILQIGGAVPPNLQTAVKVIGAQKPGQKLTFRIRREKKEIEIDVVPGERDD